jgi:hypothetical protein
VVVYSVTEGGEAGGLHCSRLEEEGAEEKESSRLELLVWLRKEMLLWLLLVGVKAAGKGGCRYFCCWSCGGGEEKKVLQRREVEREVL